MDASLIRSITFKEQYCLEVKPDLAMAKLYFLGEGMFLCEANENARKRVAEYCEAIQEMHKPVAGN